MGSDAVDADDVDFGRGAGSDLAAARAGSMASSFANSAPSLAGSKDAVLGRRFGALASLLHGASLLLAAPLDIPAAACTA